MDENQTIKYSQSSSESLAYNTYSISDIHNDCIDTRQPQTSSSGKKGIELNTTGKNDHLEQKEKTSSHRWYL